MSADYKTLYQGLITSTAVTSTYSVPAGYSTIVGSLTFVNVASASATLKVWQTPSAATAEGDAYILVQTISLGAGEKFVLTGPKTLPMGATIKVQVSLASTVNCLIEGAEMGAATTVAWGNAGCLVTNSAAPVHTATGGYQNLTWNTEVFDIDGMHSTVTNTDRLTVVTAGVYQLSFTQYFNNNATGARALRIVAYNSVGASLGVVAWTEVPPSGAQNVAFNVGGMWQANVGDFFVADWFQSSGGNLTAAAAGKFGAVRVGYQTNPMQVGQLSGGYAERNTDLNVNGTLCSITVTGDGVTPVRLTASISELTGSAASNIMVSIKDGATTVRAMSVNIPSLSYVAGGPYLDAVVAPFSGSKTFDLVQAANVGTAYTGTNIGNAYIRAEWAPGFSTTNL
jgi:hypothetical protein